MSNARLKFQTKLTSFR